MLPDQWRSDDLYRGAVDAWVETNSAA
jgi:hypothetical protein